MRLVRGGVATVALTLTTVVATAAPAVAAPPSNDTYGGRTIVGSVLPYTATLNTTEATTDADDTALNADCGAPATAASVWYQITPQADGALVVDVSESSFPAGAIVATGSPGNWTLVACGPDVVGWYAVAGETYTILAFDDQTDGSGNGGTLVISINVAPPLPSIDVTVNPVGTFDARTGSAVISGTVTCTGEADFAWVETTLQQAVGRVSTVIGYASFDVTCDGMTYPWSIEVIPTYGKFAGGRAVSVTFAFACGLFDCSMDYEERTVRLRG